MIEGPSQSAILGLPDSLLGSLAVVDVLAGCIILAGIACRLLHRRMPGGLGTSLCIGAATVGAVTAAVSHAWPAPGEFQIIVRITAVLCASWAFLGLLASWSSRRNTSEPGPSSAAILYAWSLVTGVFVIVLTQYVLIRMMGSRLLDLDRSIERLAAGGLWNLVALLAALLFWTAAAARDRQPVMALVLSASLVWWTSLMIPSAVGSYPGDPGWLLPMQPAWWTWTFQLQIGLTVVLVVAAVFQESGYRTRRDHAWPDRLDDLLVPYSRWPGYTQVESVIAAVVLLLGVFHIVRHGPPNWQLGVANCLVSLAAGTTCMFMTYRRWSPNTAGLGIALLTLAAAAAGGSVGVALSASDGSATYGVRLPVVYNAVLYAMAVMIALWYWLSRFWEQQLLNGVPWTTAGRMIPYVRRSAYLLTALAVLVAFQMALWPKRVQTSVGDDTPARLVAGVVGLLLLATVSGRNARRADSSPAAALASAFVAALVLFVFIRLPPSETRGWILQHTAVILAALALPILIAAEALPRTRWRCFALPSWWLALLVLPAGALLELLASVRPPSEWVRPSTFAILGILYVVAGRREHRRAILVLGGVLLLAAAVTLYRSYAPAAEIGEPHGRRSMVRLGVSPDL